MKKLLLAVLSLQLLISVGTPAQSGGGAAAPTANTPQQPTPAGATRYEADTAHSNVGFVVSILGGMSKVRGKFNEFTAQITYDEKKIENSSVTATIKTASIDTGIERRDGHLRTPDFFDAEKFPEIIFVSSSVAKRGNGFVAKGMFTMHGVSKEIELPFVMTGKKTDAKSGKTQMGFSARTKISRKDFGITYSNPQRPDFLGDEIEIEIDLITK